MISPAHAPRPDAAPPPLADRLAEAVPPPGEDDVWPEAAMALLAAEGLTCPEAMLPKRRSGGMARLLRLLAEIGRGDASVGRLVEGHANALELIDRVAEPPLRARLLERARRGAVFGVWGADPPDGALRFRRTRDGLELEGAKTYCSGADGLNAALVLASDSDAGEGARALLLVPVSGRLRIERSAWRPLGMRASVSARVAFDGLTLEPDALICDAAAYLADPWFSGGAMRFAAVQAGVARGLAEVAAAHLVALGREAAPHQAARLGDAAAALAGLEGALEAAASAWDAGCAPGASRAAAERAAAQGALARLAAERALLDVADIAQRAVGLGGLMETHPLQRRLRDALTYVRQPNPDGAREAAGRAFAAGLFPPPGP